MIVEPHPVEKKKLLYSSFHRIFILCNRYDEIITIYRVLSASCEFSFFFFNIFYFCLFASPLENFPPVSIFNSCALVHAACSNFRITLAGVI